jgi:hypothetical protein
MALLRVLPPKWALRQRICPHAGLERLSTQLIRPYGFSTPTSDEVPYYLLMAEEQGWSPVYNRMHKVFLRILGETYSSVDLSSSQRDWKLKIVHAALHALAGIKRLDLIQNLIETDHSRQSFSSTVRSTAEVRGFAPGAPKPCTDAKLLAIPICVGSYPTTGSFCSACLQMNLPCYMQ